ncbi:MAG: YdeI/OmpD-associated family protein [Anaerolineae bacterium]
MPQMEITTTLVVKARADWRQWLADNHATAQEIWLLFPARDSGKPGIPYVEAVEEALCFGWIDGIAKRMDDEYRAQRFTPRRPNGNWTELNKERARRMMASGLMTEAGLAKLPDLSLDAFRIAEDILTALQADAQTWQNFQNFPPLYQRVRIRFIEDSRGQPAEFQKRLDKFLHKTQQNQRFGGRLE